MSNTTNKKTIIPHWLQTNMAAPLISHKPAWLSAWHQEQHLAFMEQGLPTRHNERFKYTDLTFLNDHSFVLAKRIDENRLQNAIHQHRLQQGDAILLVIINGYFMPLLSDIHKLPQGVIAKTWQRALDDHSEIIKMHWPQKIDAKQHPFASLNAALPMDGLFFYVPDHCQLEQAIHLLSIVIDEDDFVAHPQQLFIFGEHSRCTIFEEYFSMADHAYMFNILNRWIVGKAAQIDYCKLQQDGKNAVHIANTHVQQKQDSEINVTHFAFGAHFYRDDFVVALEEPGAKCSARGFYHLEYDGQYVDYHIDIDHLAPHTQSDMLYKGILNKKARAVFNGRLYVAKEAQKITAHQGNHNLLLDAAAEIYTKPELEIYADDVKCKHGASTGQMDRDALFYLQARGIAYEEARQMLLQGFADEIVQSITHLGIKKRIQERG